MKKIFSIAVACMALQLSIFAQCPNASLTTPGFHPPADQLPPIERGNAYSETVQINIPASFDTTVPPLGTLTVTITDIHVDQITGAPTGITYTCNPGTCTFPGGSAGCVTFSGTTNDAAGQYPLTITVTANVNVPILGPQTQTLDLSTLGFSYYLTVIEAGAISVSVTANPTSVCSGDASTLTATVTNGSGSETFAWSGGAGSTSSVTVNPTSPTTYTVTVTDGGNTATGSATVAINPLPIADFTYVADDLNVTFTNTSMNATSYSWQWSGGTISLQDPIIGFPSAGTYTVSLTASNACGDDVTSQDITVTEPSAVQYAEWGALNIYPNPTSGTIEVNLNSVNGGEFTMNIFDLSGKVVFGEMFNASSGNNQKQIDLSGLPKGTYTLQMSSKEGFAAQRLVIY